MNTLLLSLLLACGAAEAPEAPAPEPAAEPQPAAEPTPEPAAAPAAAKLNVNTASEAELKAKIPGLGDKMAHEFEEYRPYKSITQFRKEMGKYVDAEKIAAYEQHIYVPIAFDSCDAATLMQLPGVDEAKAKALVEGRPYKTADAFVQALGKQIPAEQAAAATSLLAG